MFRCSAHEIHRVRVCVGLHCVFHSLLQRLRFRSVLHARDLFERHGVCMHICCRSGCDIFGAMLVRDAHMYVTCEVEFAAVFLLSVM